MPLTPAPLLPAHLGYSRTWSPLEMKNETEGIKECVENALHPVFILPISRQRGYVSSKRLEC